ncbi:MAG: methylenetetrahydrofolate reductase [Gammaproteobacteria bacterium]|nr:methylenetetrahydrofolate reductase [Gammaproteobacteria bacterium]
MSMDPLARSGPLPQGSVAQAATELLASGSLETSPDRAGDAHELAALLPAGTRVYVTHLPRHALAQSHAALKALRAAGLEPVAHIAARRLASRDELASFLERAAGEAGLSKVLALGGDEPRSLGPYADAAGMLREELFVRHGIREVGLAGYPEGHPRIPRAQMEQALAQKLAIAADRGLGAYVVTQFSFAPGRVVE